MSPPTLSPADIQQHIYNSLVHARTPDVVLNVSGTWFARYKLHRIVLIQSVRTRFTMSTFVLTSPQGFFSSLFTAGFLESSNSTGLQHVDIVFDDRNITRPGKYVSTPRFLPSRSHPLTAFECVYLRLSPPPTHRDLLQDMHLPPLWRRSSSLRFSSARSINTPSSHPFFSWAVPSVRSPSRPSSCDALLSSLPPCDLYLPFHPLCRFPNPRLHPQHRRSLYSRPVSSICHWFSPRLSCRTGSRRRRWLGTHRRDPQSFVLTYPLGLPRRVG